MWMLLTVADMPSLRMMATWSRYLRQVGELAVVDGDVGLAAGRILCQPVPGTSRSTRALTCCMRAVACARVGSSCWYRRCSPTTSPWGECGHQRHRAVLGHDRVDRPAAGQRLAPPDRAPGDGHHGRPASLSAAEPSARRA
jgi:hypothetical protein